MGTTHKIVCDDLAEYIKLGEVNGCGDKFGNIGPALICAAYRAYLGPWDGHAFRIVHDTDEEYYCIGNPEYEKKFGALGSESHPHARGHYVNVTKEAREKAGDYL